MRRHPIRTWVFLFLVNGLVLTAGFAVFLKLSLSSNERMAIEQTQQNLHTFSHSLAAVFSDNPQITFTDFAHRYAVNDMEFRITIVGPDGTVVADSRVDPATLENHGHRIEVASALSGKDGMSLHKSSVDGQVVMYYAAPIVVSGQTYALRLSLPLEHTVFFTANMTRSTIAAGVSILILTLVCSFIVSLQIVKPLNELHLATMQYERGNFAYKVEIYSPREMAELGDSFTRMASKIEENIKRQDQLERVRKDFVANVSHELKTPITSIKGFAETLIDGAIEDKQAAQHFLSIILQQVDRVSAIIEDLLMLSRLEQNSVVLERKPVDLYGLLADVCSSFELQAKNKNIKLICNHSVENDIQKDPDIFVRPVNEGLLSQAIGNIIDNALKYCPPDSIVHCLISLTPEKDKKSSILISIEDNGPGISESYRERVFERFYRVDQGRSRDMGGTGLGLSIVRHIVELHGGIVRCTERSDNLRGTRFEVIL